MSRLRPIRASQSLRPAALFLVLLAVLAVSLSGGGPAGAADYEPDQDVIDDVWSYAQETQNGFDHVHRWMRVLTTFGVVEDMTAAEAQGYADQFLAERWNPVVEELTNLEAQGDYEPDQQVTDDVWSYARETQNGYDHVLRWMRVLTTLGVVEDMTAAEAQGYAGQYLAERWNPVVEELTKLEAAASDPEPTAEPDPLQVSVTANPASPLVNESVTLSAVITNAPSGSDPSYNWEVESGDDWLSFGSGPTRSYLAIQPGSWSFRVTVSYDTGDSATSDPVTVTWTEPRPNRAPVVDTQAANYANFTGTGNAPRGVLVWKVFDGIFSDPDDDELTYTASVTDEQSQLVETLQIALSVEFSGEERLDLLTFTADADDDWKDVTPALPDPLPITVTLTATDPHGLSASVSGEFLTDWESHPALLTAASDGAAIELTFDVDLQADPAPTSGQFTVNAVNEDGSDAATVPVESVAVDGAVVTLELASALERGQSVTLDYAHDGDTPLKRAADGGDSAPSFTGQAVQVSIPDLSVPDRPSAPVTLTPASSLAETPPYRFTASWDPAPGAESYTLYWWKDGTDFRDADQLTVPAGQTSAEIAIHETGQYHLHLEVN